MDMNILLTGTLGALIGGLMLSVTCMTIYKYEKNQADKKANQLVNEFKTIYAEKLGQGVDRVYNKQPSSIKMN